MAAKSTKSQAVGKPYDGFPLTAHKGSGQWSKKATVLGRKRTFYFGPLGDWEAALRRYEREWSYLIQGRTPPALEDDEDACTMRVLCNRFLASKRNKLEAGELTSLSYQDYYRSCDRLIEHFGKHRRVDDLGPQDFEAFRQFLAKGKKRPLSVTTLGNQINRCRVILKYAYDQRLITQPVHFGQSFDPPSRKQRRKVQNASAPRMFTRDELLTVLTALDGKPVKVKREKVTLKADPQLKAMTLLGLNAALGVTDCANLHGSHLDLDAGWLDYPRVKTETPRRVPLWAETIKALREVLANRREPKASADAGIVFLTRTRQRWVRTKPGKTPDKDLHLNAISQAFGKLLHKLDINGRSGLNFYTLRRQFEIVAGESRDQVAVDAVMGHTDDSMGAIYRQNVISDQRLRDVTNTVRRWLWPRRK